MRKVSKVLGSTKVIEGAGVKLSRAFGYSTRYDTDPFLLLDHFGSKDPDDYLKGFPWHPHRGIETVTYMLSGSVEHSDSLGNKGIINPGDIQWMSAGKGLIHQEMPVYEADGLEGFQLWVNLRSDHKMSKPRYREITGNKVKTIESAEGIIMRIIAGEYHGNSGPVNDLSMDRLFMDISMPEETNLVIDCDDQKRYIAYVFRGMGYFCEHGSSIFNGQTILFEGAGPINVTSHGGETRFILIAGEPLAEEIAWQGPIVMNTEEQLQKAFEEYREGKFTAK